MKITNIRPQKGFQEKFLSTTADFAIGGGMAGCGKTYALLLDPVRYTSAKPVKGFGATIFRRTYPQINMEGGLWDESSELYPTLNAQPNVSDHIWKFPKGQKIKFAHLQHTKNILDYQGAQIPLISFDEITHFTSEMVFYLSSRNRSTCGIKPYMRGTCNPDPDSWVYPFVQWWINPETGFPIPERDAVIRYYIINQGGYIWGDTVEDVVNQVPHFFEGKNEQECRNMVKSFTFIAGKEDENKILNKKDPTYKAKLLGLPEEQRARLLYGCWKSFDGENDLFNRTALDDMFTNPVSLIGNEKRYITIDHARFGKDFCVIMSWMGWRVVRIDILASSDTNDIVKVLQKLRYTYNVPSSQIIVDQDGIGVKDALNCKTFLGGGTCYKVGGKVPFYKNKRAQCFYKASEKVNAHEVRVDWTNTFVHSKSSTKQTREILVKGNMLSVKQLLTDDLRTLKVIEPDSDQRKRITLKPEQKTILGRSPDFGDNFALRASFEFIKTVKGLM